MNRFSNSTIGKGLEKTLNALTQTEDKDKVLALVAEEIKPENFEKGSLILTIYETIGEKISSTNFENYFPSETLIEKGRNIFEELKSIKSYSLGIAPDRRKLNKFRKKESEFLKKYQ